MKVFRIPDKDLKTFWAIVTPTGAGLVHSTTSRDVYELLKSGGIEPDEVDSSLVKNNNSYEAELKYYYTR